MALHKNIEIDFVEFAGKNSGLVKEALSPYFPPAGNDHDDLMQAGMLGLWNARGKYKPEKGEFKTYAKWIIHNEVIDLIRRSNTGPQRALNESSSMDEAMGDQENTTRHELISDPEAMSIDERVILSDWISSFTHGLLSLPGLRGDSAFKVWIAGFTTEEVAKFQKRKRSAVKTDLYRARHDMLPNHADLPF